jgi:hypothetical protein
MHWVSGYRRFTQSKETAKNKTMRKGNTYRGGDCMTVASKIKGTIANLRSAYASLELFALETNDKRAKQAFETAAQETKAVLESLEHRLREVEREEPEYKQN